jgi:hypothetical protein
MKGLSVDVGDLRGFIRVAGDNDHERPIGFVET